MIFVLKLICFILCLVFYFLFRQDREKWQWPLVGSAVLGIGFMIVGFFIPEPPPGGDPVPFQHAIGYMLGKEVAKGDPPAKLIVIQSPGMYYYKAHAIIEAEKKGLLEGLGREVELVQYLPPIESVDPEEDDLADWLHTTRWRRHFADWLSGQSDVDAVVSFIGMPEQFKRSVMKELPPVYMYSVIGMEEEATLVTSGKLKAFATFRMDYDPDRKVKAKDPEALFNARYRLIRVEN